MRSQRLVVGAELVRADVDGKVQLVLEVEMLLIAGGVAQGQPGGVGAEDGAGNQPHALVFHVQTKCALRADLQDAEVDFLRLQTEARLGEDIGGQFFQQLIETEIGVGELGGLLGGHRQIDAAQSAEEFFQIALLE
jgi:hypothetical protein